MFAGLPGTKDWAWPIGLIANGVLKIATNHRFALRDATETLNRHTQEYIAAMHRALIVQ
jgi:hypothetical protein